MTGDARAARDAARRAAADLELRRRMREVEQAILARAPENDVEPSIEQIAAVMELLGDPQRSYPVVHLTGTNGKTSTTRMVATLLQELGLRTGRFTSPHLHDIRERIALDGAPVSYTHLDVYKRQVLGEDDLRAVVMDHQRFIEAETLARQIGFGPADALPVGQGTVAELGDGRAVRLVVAKL